MSSIRRAGVIADYGSLEAYRTHVIAERDECARGITHHLDIWPGYVRDGRVLAMARLELADWKADLAWVDSELVKNV